MDNLTKEELLKSAEKGLHDALSLINRYCPRPAYYGESFVDDIRKIYADIYQYNRKEIHK